MANPQIELVAIKNEKNCILITGGIINHDGTD